MVNSVEAVDAGDEEEGNLRLYLEEWRARRGWTQEELARRAGTSRLTVRRIERMDMWERKCRHDVIWRLAHALGIEPWQLDDPQLSREDMITDEWLPPDEPLPDVPEEEAVPLATWMRGFRITARWLTHETGMPYETTITGARSQWVVTRYQPGISYNVVYDIVEGKPVRPSRLEVVRICRTLGLQPSQITEFRALPAALRAPVRLHPGDAKALRDLPADHAHVRLMGERGRTRRHQSKRR